ncbi:MAG: hypothetical protein CMJ58_28300 [Planctomycetaceae bacterium]|nr:hypothetical protein [Planctomycetaceae bacterium]
MVNRLAAAAKDTFVADLVLKGLCLLSRDDIEANGHLQTVKEEVRAHGSHLMIFCKKKETKSYLLEVFYKIRPDNAASVGIVRFTDKKTGHSGQTDFIDLCTYSDIYPLTGTISVTGGVVTIKPRESFRASISTERYCTPITIETQKILKSKESHAGASDT